MTLQKKTLVSKKSQPSTRNAAAKVETGNVVTARKIVGRNMIMAKRAQ